MTRRPRRTKRPRCMALTKAGDQCENPAAIGQDFCGSHGPRVGRKSKLTEPVAAALEEAARRGLFNREAALVAGIDPRTLYRWMEAADADEEAGNTGSAYVQLRQRLTRATAEAELEAIEAVRRAALGTPRTLYDEDGEPVEVNDRADWRAAAWYLERKHSARWSSKQTIRHEGDVDLSRPKVITADGPDKALELARILNAAGALPPAEDQAA